MAGSLSVAINLIAGYHQTLSGLRAMDFRTVKSEIAPMQWKDITYAQMSGISARYCSGVTLYVRLADYGNTNYTYTLLPHGGMRITPVNSNTGMLYDVQASFWEA